jgi:hypothetical protein
MGKKTYPGTVLERLTTKLETLRKLSRSPRPAPGTYVPRNLRDFARWHDESLEIYPIGSPNEVTTTHHRYGRISLRGCSSVMVLAHEIGALVDIAAKPLQTAAQT